jgi:hypothetical protein
VFEEILGALRGAVLRQVLGRSDHHKAKRVRQPHLDHVALDGFGEPHPGVPGTAADLERRPSSGARRSADPLRCASLESAPRRSYALLRLPCVFLSSVQDWPG